MSAVPQIKYRPVLTGNQISHLIKLCKADGSKDSLSCLSQLVMYEFKIQNSILTEAYTEKPRESLAISLGFEETTISSEPDRIRVSAEALYNLWLASPGELTVSQLQAVQRYRYENNKMTVDEEKKFESEVLGIS